MIFIGVDPGASGGIGVVGSDGRHLMAFSMPDTERDLWDHLRGFTDAAREGRARAMIERVHSMPRQGVASSFKFGRSYGTLRMALVAAGIPFEEVAPHIWQRALGCLSGGQKNVTKAKAQQLFPGLKMTHAIADALLIAEYCRRLNERNHDVTEPQRASV